MIMKKNIYNYLITAMVCTSFLFISCSEEFLTGKPTDKIEAGGPATEGAIISSLASAYQILLFDSYANNNYNSVLLMSDLRSDDIYKGGGDAGDQMQLYKLSIFTSTGDETVNGLWNIYFTGLKRSNEVLIACENAVDVSPDKLEQYEAEGHFLRAYYVHLLWKYFGNIPYFEEPLNEPPYMTRQMTPDEVYAEIMEDIDFACQEGKLQMKTAGGDLGRASRAAALMLKARVVLYQKDRSRYAEITHDMATIIQSGLYSLMPDFGAIWDDNNEFCSESVFESNQLPGEYGGKTWSSAWQGYGTNLPAYVSPNALNDPAKVFQGGWGFGPVRQAAYDIYESGDTRREGSINVWEASLYTPRFQDTGLFQRKYAARVGYNPPPGDVDLNYTNNLRIFRYAETLLNYVELVRMHEQSEAQGVSAQDCFDRIRQRAFGDNTHSITPTSENIKLERRKEFLGEGMRFWDLVRWGDATTALTENDAAHNSTRTFQEWMKYVPVPQSEIDKTAGTEFALKQNQGWN
jgi:hypothetical protein